MAWILWREFEENGYDTKNLNYFLSLSITNRETQNILARAMRNIVPDIKGVPAWGGFQFYTDTPEGQAILGELLFGRNYPLIFADLVSPLGSPNAQAFSYLLLQHKAELGNLHINKIRVFHDDRDEPGPNLLFFVEPVPADDNERPAEDQENSGSVSDLLSDQSSHSATTVENTAVDPAVDAAMVHEGIQPDLKDSSRSRFNTTVKGARGLSASLSHTVPLKPELDQEDKRSHISQDSPDIEWQKAKRRGQEFLRAMRGSNSKAGDKSDPPRKAVTGAFYDKDLGKDETEHKTF